MKKRASLATVTIVGPGSLGTVLARSLHAAGCKLDELVIRPGRPKQHAVKLARLAGAQLATIGTAKFVSDVIWICTPDDAIVTVAQKIGARLSHKQVLLHSSGVLTSEVLRCGDYAVASAHPMMSFTRSSPAPLRGVAFAIEGDLRARKVAGLLIDRCDGESFVIAQDQKALYHAFGSFCSPLLIAALIAGEEVAQAAGIARGKIRKLRGPILRRTLENYLAEGAAKALSGPLRRGDVATIQRHRIALKNLPEIRRLYSDLSRLVVTTLPGKNKKQLLKALATS